MYKVNNANSISILYSTSSDVYSSLQITTTNNYAAIPSVSSTSGTNGGSNSPNKKGESTNSKPVESESSTPEMGNMTLIVVLIFASVVLVIGVVIVAILVVKKRRIINGRVDNDCNYDESAEELMMARSLPPIIALKLETMPQELYRC